MKGPLLMWLALLAAAATLFVLYTGANATNAFALAQSAGTAPPAEAAGLVAQHKLAAEGMGVLVLILAAWITFADRRPRPKALAWAAVACIVIEAVLGSIGAPLGPAAGTIHALLGPVLLALLISVASLAWPGWEIRPVPMLQDKGWPSLRGLARTTAGLLVIQVLLGASFRHNVMGVLWHILGAFLSALFAIALIVFITQVSESSPLRPPAILLTILLGVQVTLGIVLISITDPNKHPMFSMIATAAHVLVGSCTLACSIWAAMLVWRAVEPPKPAAA